MEPRSINFVFERFGCQESVSDNGKPRRWAGWFGKEAQQRVPGPLGCSRDAISTDVTLRIGLRQEPVAGLAACHTPIRQFPPRRTHSARVPGGLALSIYWPGSGRAFLCNTLSSWTANTPVDYSRLRGPPRPLPANLRIFFTRPSVPSSRATTRRSDNYWPMMSN
jgi:hypothetical protein